MYDLIENMIINNFKSIKHIELKDCKRINLFIGKPNTGKSNILEALTLLSMPFIHFDKRYMKPSEFIRINDESELFFDGDTLSDVTIEINGKQTLSLSYSRELSKLAIAGKGHARSHYAFAKNIFKPNRDAIDSLNDIRYKSFHFPSIYRFETSICKFLQPPHGANIVQVIEKFPDVMKQIIEISHNCTLLPFIDKMCRKLKFAKELGKGLTFEIPFSAVSASLQRVIFFKTAIKTNTKSQIILDTPDAQLSAEHARIIAQDIIEDQTNQYFLTAQHHDFAHTIITHAQHDTAIFQLDTEHQQTNIKRLNVDEIQQTANQTSKTLYN